MKQIRDLMSERLVTLNERIAVPRALAQLKAEKVHHALVVELGGVAGVVCRCDLELARTDATVSTCMKRHFVFIEDRASPSDAVHLMQRWGVGLLPVFASDGHVVGVVTRRDLRESGYLPGRRGFDRCASCGSTHSLTPQRDDTTPVFCRECLEPPLTSNGYAYTLGGGD
jgi:CBS-domain-containing membrane protein